MQRTGRAHAAKDACIVFEGEFQTHTGLWSPDTHGQARGDCRGCEIFDHWIGPTVNLMEASLIYIQKWLANVARPLVSP